MEEEPDASESDAPEPESSLEPSPARNPTLHPASGRALAPRILRRLRPNSTTAGRFILALSLIAAAMSPAPSPACADALQRVKSSGRLLYGSDMEGGGPYAYPEPDAPGGLAGFEVDLMRSLAGELGVEPVFSQGQ